MPRINRKVRVRPQNRATRAMVLELLLGPNGKSVFETPEEAAQLWLTLREKLSPGFAAQWHAEGNSKNYAEIADQYARDVVENRILACLYVRQACQRHLNDLARIASGDWPYRFDPAKANRVCHFVELLPHVKGNWAARAERIKLEPWQMFSLCCVFGWVKKASGLRRFSLAYEEVARKNAKSTKIAGVGLYMLACDGEFGAEVYSGATSLDQALEVYRPARQMMERSPELRMILGVTPAIKKIELGEDGSRFEPVIGKPGDGASPTCGLVDEYHEHDSDELFDTLRTGMGAREQPLEWVITTAGSNTAGPCKLLQGDIIKILRGETQREEVFGIIYTVDAGDDWAADSSLEKANPNIGISVSREFLETERNAALTNPRKQGVFKTKHLCMWVGALAAYFDARRFEELADRALRIEDFLGQPCIASIDLATKRDLVARIFAFKKIVRAKTHYYLFPRFYLPELEVLKPENQHYQGWVKQGFLIQHPGAVVDFDLIQEEAIEGIRHFKAREFVFDPWNAAQFGQNIGKATRAALVELQQAPRYLSPAMKEMDAVIAEGRVHHDGNPVLEWCVANVNGKEDANENVMPRKEEGRDENKIDGAVASMMCILRLMQTDAKRSVYSTRGVLTVGRPEPEPDNAKKAQAAAAELANA